MGHPSSKHQVTKADRINKESLMDNLFAVLNLHITSATGGAVAVLVLGLAMGGYLLARLLAKKKLLRGPRREAMGAATAIELGCAPKRTDLPL